MAKFRRYLDKDGKGGSGDGSGSDDDKNKKLDDLSTDDKNKKLEDDKKGEDDSSGDPIPKHRFDEVIGQRNELRKQVTDLSTKMDGLMADQKTAADKKLEEEKEFETLATQRAGRISELEADLQASKKRADGLNDVLEASLKVRIDSIPETMRGLVPTDYDPLALMKWLDDNVEKLTKPLPPEFDAGKRGGKPDDSVKLDKDTRHRIKL